MPLANANYFPNSPLLTSATAFASPLIPESDPAAVVTRGT